MNGNSLASLCIRDVSKLLRNKEITATRLSQECLKIANNTQYLNAFITINGQSALEKARVCETEVVPKESLLNGIPIAIKDNFCTKNILTSCGSRMLANYLPPYDATIVDKLCNKSGAILLGKTNLDEFAMGSSSVTSHYGPTANPWKSFGQPNFKSTAQLDQSETIRHHTTDTSFDYNAAETWFMAGGSSTGSAVAVATGSVFAAVGTDTGGSNRHPASMVGVVGFKPSYGIISRFGLIPLAHSLDTVSILARHVDDIEILFEHMIGADENDLTSLDLNEVQDNSNKDWPIDCSNILDNKNKIDIDSLKKKIVVGIPKEFSLCDELSEEVGSLWDKTIKLLSSGEFSSIFDVVEISTPNIVYATECYTILSSCEVASNMSCYDGVRYGFSDRSTLSSLDDSDFNRDDWYKLNRDQGFNAEVKKRILLGNYFLHGHNVQKYYFQALKVRQLVYRDLVRAFNYLSNDNTNSDNSNYRGVDVILVPSTPTTATKNIEWLRKQDENKLFAEDYYLIPANLAGLPSIQLPVTLSKSGLPIGLQLISNQFADRKLLSISKLFEKHIFQYNHHLQYTDTQ